MAAIVQPFADRSSALRRAIQTDALVVAASSVGLLAAAGPLAALTGLPVTALLAAGALFLPYAAWLWYVASRPVISRRVGWALTLVNTIWVLDSALLLLSGWLPLTDAGWWLIVAQAVFVAAIAEWQFIALYRTRRQLWGQ